MKVSKGTVTGSNNAVTVTNLGFKPLVILVRANAINSAWYTSVYSDKILFGHTNDTSFYLPNTTTATAFTPTITNSGFTLATGTNASYDYIAFGI